MSDNSKIEWTNASWNAVRGCTKVSPGCAHCYAETFAERFRGVQGHPYEQGFDLRLVPEKLTEPLRWRKPRRVFVNSMSDLFQDGVPAEYIDRVFVVMALASQHTFQILTKRPERMRVYLSADVDVLLLRWAKAAADLAVSTQKERPDGHESAEHEWWDRVRCEVPWPLPNVWLGVSVENQHFADERIPLLLQTPAAVRFISAEPLLGPVDLEFYLDPVCECETRESLHSGDQHDESCPAGGGKLDWVIVGGESGPGARPMDLTWARAIVAQCKSAGVACFLKQLGTNPHERVTRDIAASQPLIPYVKLRSKKGGDPAEWPEDLRVREYPEARG